MVPIRILSCCVIFIALFAFCLAEAERVKKAVVYPYGAYPYAAYPYAVPHAIYPYADDGSYFQGKYDPLY